MPQRYMIQIPQVLYEKLMAEAKKEGRSINSTAIKHLERSLFNGFEKEAPKPKKQELPAPAEKKNNDLEGRMFNVVEQEMTQRLEAVWPFIESMSDAIQRLELCLVNLVSETDKVDIGQLIDYDYPVGLSDDMLRDTLKEGILTQILQDNEGFLNVTSAVLSTLE